MYNHGWWLLLGRGTTQTINNPLPTHPTQPQKSKVYVFPVFFQMAPFFPDIFVFVILQLLGTKRQFLLFLSTTAGATRSGIARWRCLGDRRFFFFSVGCRYLWQKAPRCVNKNLGWLQVPVVYTWFLYQKDWPSEILLHGCSEFETFFPRVLKLQIKTHQI